MGKGKKIELTTDEIRMIRFYCQDKVDMKPKNFKLVSSILSKIDSLESSESPIRIKSTGGNKRGRPRKVTSLVPEPLEVIPVIITSIEEPKLTGKKRGRSKKVFKSEEQKEVSYSTEPKKREIKEISSINEPESMTIVEEEVPSKIEPEPIEEPTVRNDPVEEHKPEPQPIIPSGNPEQKQEEPDQTTNTDSEKPILSRFQTFLKKLRPSKEQ
jgi:hypothetical protein